MITLINSGVFVPSAAGNSPNSPFTLTLNWTPTDGNFLVLTLGFHYNNTGGISGISQTGATWNPAVAVNLPGGAGSSEGDSEIWYAANILGATTSITVTLSGNNYGGAVTVSEWSGLTIATPLDQTASNHNESPVTTLDSGTTGTTAQASELWIASFECATVGGTNTFSGPTNGFTILGQGSQPGSSTFGSHAASYLIASSTGAANTQLTASNEFSSALWEGAIATFKAAAPVITRPSLFVGRSRSTVGLAPKPRSLFSRAALLGPVLASRIFGTAGIIGRRRPR